MSLPPAIFIMGPTASGKTALTVELISHIPSEIISVDSALVYRGMDIGTAKPDPNILRVAPHHLINIRDPAQSYSVAEFHTDALAQMEEITRRGRIPILSGGTMLYFRGLQFGLSALPSADPDIRRKIYEEAMEKGWKVLHARLSRIDPISANRINCNDSQRIQRALEVYELTSKPLSELFKERENFSLPYRVIKIIVSPADRNILHKRIEVRFCEMLRLGFIEEVKSLYSRGDLNLQLPSMRAVGYRQIWQYLDGLLTLEDMKQKVIVATRQYAKRQLTWLRSERDAFLVNSTEDNFLEQVLNYLDKHAI